MDASAPIFSKGLKRKANLSNWKTTAMQSQRLFLMCQPLRRIVKKISGIKKKNFSSQHCCSVQIYRNFSLSVITDTIILKYYIFRFTCLCLWYPRFNFLKGTESICSYVSYSSICIFLSLFTFYLMTSSICYVKENTTFFSCHILTKVKC